MRTGGYPTRSRFEPTTAGAFTPGFSGEEELVRQKFQAPLCEHNPGAPTVSAVALAKADDLFFLKT